MDKIAELVKAGKAMCIRDRVLYVVVEAIILVLKRPLKSLLSTGAWEVFEQNLFPISDIAWIIFMLALHTGLFILLWSQAENRSFKLGEILSIIIGGLILAGSPISLSVLTNMGYAAQGAQMLASYSLLSNLMGMAQPLSRLGWVLLVKMCIRDRPGAMLRPPAIQL